VRIIDRPATNSSLEVTEHKLESPDEHLYASVDGVSISKQGARGGYKLTLEGKFPDFEKGCMKISEVKLDSEANNVLVVQPISKIVDGAGCLNLAKDKRFRISVPMERSFVGEGLLHVRVLNGASLNKLITL
jgi:hypothetical protein